MRRLVAAERRHFDARQRRVPGGIHRMRDHASLFLIPHVARGANLGTHGGIAQIVHAEVVVFIRSRPLDPNNLIVQRAAAAVKRGPTP